MSRCQQNISVKRKLYSSRDVTFLLTKLTKLSRSTNFSLVQRHSHFQPLSIRTHRVVISHHRREISENGKYTSEKRLRKQ